MAKRPAAMATCTSAEGIMVCVGVGGGCVLVSGRVRLVERDTGRRCESWVRLWFCFMACVGVNGGCVLVLGRVRLVERDRRELNEIVVLFQCVGQCLESCTG